MTEHSDKGPAHPLGVAEPRGQRHLLDRLAGRLHKGLRRLDAQALNCFGGRRAGFGNKSAGKLPRAHANALSKVVHGQEPIEVFAHP